MEEKKNNVIPDEELDAVSGGKRVEFTQVELIRECPTCHHWVTPIDLAGGRRECPDCHGEM